MSKLTAQLLDRPVQIELTRRAERALGERDCALCLEMELYFSCLIRKRVLVTQSCDSDFTVEVNDRLHLGFRPVMTRGCSIDDTDENGRPPLSDFPIEKPERYIPHWLSIDYVRGEWRAEFGYLDA